MKTALALPFALAFLVACKEGGPAPAGGAAGGPVAVCAREGEQCRYAEGKIGLCTARPDGCDGSASCLVCMSLH